MGQSIDCQPHFGHEVGLRKASSANHAAQVGEKTAVYLLSDRLLDMETPLSCSLLFVGVLCVSCEGSMLEALSIVHQSAYADNIDSTSQAFLTDVKGYSHIDNKAHLFAH